MEDLWYLTACGSCKRKSNPNLDTWAWVVGGRPPCCPTLFLSLWSLSTVSAVGHCPTSVTLSSSGLGPYPGIAGKSQALGHLLAHRRAIRKEPRVEFLTPSLDLPSGKCLGACVSCSEGNRLTRW